MTKKEALTIANKLLEKYNVPIVVIKHHKIYEVITKTMYETLWSHRQDVEHVITFENVNLTGA